MLSALALGARELAGLPGPTGVFALNRVEAFPSKRLAPRLEAKLLDTTTTNDPVDAITEDLTRVALTSAREGAETSIPEAAREKVLRVGGRLGSVTKSTDHGARKSTTTTAASSFAPLAAECFVMPLVNRFWLYLRDLSTASLAGNRTLGPGTATLLDPIFLCKFLGTMSVLIDASRYSPHFLAVLAPESLQLAAFGLRGFTTKKEDSSDGNGDGGDESVSAALLEFALVTVDTCMSVDAGRTLARDFYPLVGTLREWAEEEWRTEEARGKVERVGRAAAGLLLRLDEVSSRSVLRSMLPM
jgi:telomere length regulation protein